MRSGVQDQTFCVYLSQPRGCASTGIFSFLPVYEFHPYTFRGGIEVLCEEGNSCFSAGIDRIIFHEKYRHLIFTLTIWIPLWEEERSLFKIFLNSRINRSRMNFIFDTSNAFFDLPFFFSSCSKHEFPETGYLISPVKIIIRAYRKSGAKTTSV